MSTPRRSASNGLDVPFVSSSELVTAKMLDVAKLRPTDILYDLGCGDGRVIIAAAQSLGVRCVGIERRKELVTEASKKTKELNLSEHVGVILGDFFAFNLNRADVVVSYLLTAVNKQLEAKLDRELKIGARVISHDFEFPDWKPTQFVMINEGWLDHKIFLYVKKNSAGFRKKLEKPESGWRSL